jgi:stage IV sporulation protein FB
MRGPLVSWPVVSRNGVFFWLFATVVRIRFTFFLVALLAAEGAGRGIEQILEWIAVATAGVLVHELGHVAAARHYGFDPSVELYTMGGVTTWRNPRPMRRVERIAISLAGPLTGFVLGGVTWVSFRVLAGTLAPLLYLALYDFLWINVAWGFFNLLPILPLDGAQALEAVLERFERVRHPRRTMRVVSLVVGGAVAVLAFGLGQTWVAVLAALLAYNNAQAMRGMRGIWPEG